MTTDPTDRAHPPAQGAHRRNNPIARLLAFLGPGLIAGAADDDPTAIATYAQAGASTGYALLWTTLLTLPMMVTVQYTAAKVALVHRKELAATLRERFPRPVLYPAIAALVVANTINAGADVGAIGAALNLIIPVPIHILIVPIALLLLGLLIFGSYALIETVFKWLTLTLLAYVASSFLAKPDLSQMLVGTFIPHISLQPVYLTLLVAVLGGNISPYLFFWQADLEVAEQRTQRAQRRHRQANASSGSSERNRPGADPTRMPSRRRAGKPLDRRLRHVAWDTLIGMLFSTVIFYFIEVASAATLYRAGTHNITSAVQAAEALRPLLGNWATTLWAVGMIGSGLLAVPALAGSAADGVAALFGWPRGLDRPPRKAKRFYIILTAILLIGLLVNFLGFNPIQALVLSAALNGVLTPPLLVLLLLIANKRDVMGRRTNGLFLNLLGWGTTVLMAVAALGLLLTTFWGVGN